MSLNLHATVRAAIQSVNADIPATYYESTGNVVNRAARQVPQYKPPVQVMIQSQPPSGKDLKHLEFLNIQGTTRVVYLYSNPAAISRVAARGGDILTFAGFENTPIEKWLVVEVMERWDVRTNNAPESQLPAMPPTSGWTKLFCVLQVDQPAAALATQAGLLLTTQGGAPIVIEGNLP